MEPNDLLCSRNARPQKALARANGTSRRAISPGRVVRFSIPLSEGVAKAALYCAHRTSTFLSCAFCEQGGHLPPHSPSPPISLTLSSRGWPGLVPQLRTSNDHSFIVGIPRAPLSMIPPSLLVTS